MRLLSVISGTFIVRVLSLCWEAVGAFYSLSQLSWDGLVSYPQHSLGRVSLYREAVSVFYSPSRLGWDGLVSYSGHSFASGGSNPADRNNRRILGYSKMKMILFHQVFLIILFITKMMVKLYISHFNFK